MLRLKKWAIVAVVVFTSCIVAGCRKEKEEPSRKAPLAKSAEDRAKKVCERAVSDFLEALAANDNRGALEFLDVEGMLREREEGPTEPAEMEEMLLRMMEREKREKRTGLTFVVTGSHITDGKAGVRFYSDGKLVGQRAYAMTRRDGRWKISCEALPVVLLAMKEGPSLTSPR